MVGTDQGPQKLGLIPCAISWLYATIERRKERTWTDLTVSVSAIELHCGEAETLRDLLAEVAPSSAGNSLDRPAAQISLSKDPIHGIQICNHNRVKSPTAERAASLLDSALASRLHGSQTKRGLGGMGADVILSTPHHTSVMFFTLHVQPPRTDIGTIGRASRGPSRLTMIDVCSRVKLINDTNQSRSGFPPFEMGSVIFSLLNGHKNVARKGSKLALLLGESLGNLNSLTTVIAQVSDIPAYLPEALSTVQLASRIRRAQKRAKESTSCSPCGRSLCKERRGHQLLSLRSFHSSGEVNMDVPRLRFCGELDEPSSSDQSCDTVIHIDSDGSVQPSARRTLAQPEFVPIIPSLHHCKPDVDDPEFTELLQELLKIPQPQSEQKKEEIVFGKLETQRTELGHTERYCLKCDTFAELQERLGCIDGSEVGTDVPKLCSNNPSNDKTTFKVPLQKDGKQTGGQTESSEAPQTQRLLNQEFFCSQSSKAEKQTDGAFPCDAFQREDSGLYDCEEGSAASSTEEPGNQSLSRGLIRRTERSELPDSGTSKAPTNTCSMDPKNTAVPGPPVLVLQSAESQRVPESGDWVKPEGRTSPVGKSSSISPPQASPTSSPHPSFATSVILEEILPHLHTEELKEMKATITVTVQQPLDRDGHDELVFSMVEEVTISGALDRDGKGHSIVRIRDTSQPTSHTQGSACSQRIRIISNVSEEAAGYSNMPVNPTVQAAPREPTTQKPSLPSRREKRLLPSFINPTLIETDCDCSLDETEPIGSSDNNDKGGELLAELRQDNQQCLVERRALEAERGSFAFESHEKKFNSLSMSSRSHISYDRLNFEDTAFYDEAECNITEQRHRITGTSHPRGREHVYPTNTPRGLVGADVGRQDFGNSPKNIAASPGRQATSHNALKTNSLPRGWHNANHREGCCGGHVAGNHRDPAEVTSFTPCSPRDTMERRQSKERSLANYGPAFPPSQKYTSENRQEDTTPKKKAMVSLSGTLSPSIKQGSLSERPNSPVEVSSRLFSAKLEQLTSRTNSLGRTAVEFRSLDRGSSSTSVSFKGSSKGSIEGNSKGGPKGIYDDVFRGQYKESYEGDSTLPRVGRSPKRSPRVPGTDPCHHSNTSNNSPSSQSPKPNRSKLSSIGKLKMASPRVRRLSNPGTKTLTLSHKALQQSINRSASLSPDGKSFSTERTASFLSSSPPWSTHSLSLTQGYSPSCLNTISPIQGVIHGRLSDLMKNRESSTSPEGSQIAHPLYRNHSPLPSPYSQMTTPRNPSHMSGHDSDATSVLSGELPPAMGKTCLLFPNRNSVVSSGYESLVRDSEATGSSNSNRDSVSDKSSSLLNIIRSSRMSRRRGNTGSHQRRLSHDAPSSMRRSASGPRARWVDRGIPEAFEIKVYEIDDVEKMQRRAGAGKQCFSAKLKFLEHRQQRIEEVRAKYYNLMRELGKAKQSLMLEPDKWNQEFDLWQTFEVDSLEHLEALEVVTARLESRVSLCKANVMMVTCFDVSTKRRQKKRRRTASQRQQHGILGI